MTTPWLTIRFQCFRRPVLPSDWTRFNVHAARVRKVIGCLRLYTSLLGRNVRVVPSVYQALINAAQSLPLIPSITTLTWDNIDDYSFKYVRLFITPTITSLRLCLTGRAGGEHDFSLFSLLPSLPRLCPLVSSLKLDADVENMLLDVVQKREMAIHMPAALSAFQNLVHLQRLDLSLMEMPENALCNLVSINCLRDLRIYNNPPHPFQSPMLGDGRNQCFPCLEHLQIDECSIGFVMWMLSNMRQTSLKVIILDFWEHPSVTEWKTLFLMMCDRLDHHSLQNIDINHWNGVADVGLTMEHLAPLLSFTNLAQMWLRYVGVTLDDDDVASIAIAWPHLEKLNLRDQPESPRSVVTFRGLASLVRNCPNLQHLTLPSFDATGVLLNDLDLYGTFRCNEKLRFLNVRKSLIDNPALVAALLSALFPNLQAIFAENFKEQWSQVNKSIEISTTVRKQKKLPRLRMHKLNLNFIAERMKQMKSQIRYLGIAK